MTQACQPHGTQENYSRMSGTEGIEETLFDETKLGEKCYLVERNTLLDAGQSLATA